MPFETRGLEAKKKKSPTSVTYKMKAEKLQNWSHQSSALNTALSVCQAGLGPSFVYIIPTAINSSMLRTLMGRRLCSELASSLLFWQYVLINWGSNIMKNTRNKSYWGVGCSCEWPCHVAGLSHHHGEDKVGYFNSVFTIFWVPVLWDSVSWSLTARTV